MAVGDLPEELLLDIFARLGDHVDLLRCVATCRRWLHVVAGDNAVFLRRAGVLPENNNASLLLGSFSQNETPDARRPTATENKFGCPPKFWRLHGLPPVHHVDRPRIGLFSILPNHDGLFNYAKPLASRHGLLLVRLMPAPLDHRKLHLAVCHPLLGGVHLVPPPLLHLHPPFLGRDVTGYALVTGHGGEGLENQRQRQLAFRVLFTVVHPDGVVYAYSYSSATGSWSEPTMCPLQMRDLTMSGPRAGVVDDRGTTHWLYRDKKTSFYYTLDVSADAARVSLDKLPMQVLLQPPFPCIAGGGKLSFLLSRPEYHDTLLQLWTRQDQDDNAGGWQCSHLARYETSPVPFMTIGFVESTGGILVNGGEGLACLYIENNEPDEWTNVVLVRGSRYPMYPTKICFNSMCQGYNSCNKCAYNNEVLYEMDWSSYLLHLSAWSPRAATR